MTEHAPVTPLLLDPADRRLLAELLDRSVEAGAPTERTLRLAKLRARLDAGGDHLVAQVNASDGFVVGVAANAPLTCIWADWDVGEKVALTSSGPVVADLVEHTAQLRAEDVERTLRTVRNAVPLRGASSQFLFVTQDDHVLAARRIESPHAEAIDEVISEIAEVVPELAAAPFDVHVIQSSARSVSVTATHRRDPLPARLPSLIDA